MHPDRRCLSDQKLSHVAPTTRSDTLEKAHIHHLQSLSLQQRGIIFSPRRRLILFLNHHLTINYPVFPWASWIRLRRFQRSLSRENAMRTQVVVQRSIARIAGLAIPTNRGMRSACLRGCEVRYSSRTEWPVPTHKGLRPRRWFFRGQAERRVIDQPEKVFFVATTAFRVTNS
jgi:hypothetical protein